MTELRVLTVRQPWAWAIIHGGKDVENRVRNVAGEYRGLVAIHAGLAEDVNAFSLAPSRAPLNAAADSWYEALPKRERERVQTEPWHARRGAIIGVVDLVDVHEDTGPGSWDARDAVCCESPWAEHDAHHLVLANPRALREPIPFKGALGLRRLPDDVAARVWAGVQ